MKKYQVKINNMNLEIIQDDDGKFITPYLCIEDWGKFGTALKPSFEPIIVARKPFKGSLVDNVIEHGVGGINIDECRVAFNGDKWKNQKSGNTAKAFNLNEQQREAGTGVLAGYECEANENGRFPANTILTYDETDFDEVCGGFPDTKGDKRETYYRKNPGTYWCNSSDEIKMTHYKDSGSASRYFMNCKYTGKDEETRRYIYTPKASKKDRDEGLNVETEEYMLKEDIDENVKNNIKRLLNL